MMLTDKTEVVDKSCLNISERILQRDIEKFLTTYFTIFGTYIILDNGIINVDGDITLNTYVFSKLNLTEIPIQFGHIKGNFNFENTNITTMKGFPHTVTNNFSIKGSLKIKSLEFSPQCNEFFCGHCEKLESLDGLNCETFNGLNLNLKEFGTTFNCKHFFMNRYPNPNKTEFKQLIKLMATFDNNQEEITEKWILIINKYPFHKDLFRVAQEFEMLYNEPLIKPENKIEIINTDLTMSL